jgi:peptidylprolyl isomerase
MFEAKRSLKFVLPALLLAAVAAAARTPQMPTPKRPEPVARPQAKSIPAPDDVAAAPEDAMRTDSGLAWRLLSEPAKTPDRPGPNDVVTTLYTGWTTDGTMFDTTETLGRAREFRVTGVIAGFEEAAQLLSIGEKGRFWIPSELAYNGAPRKPQGMLVFDLEIVGIQRGPQPAIDSAAPPEDAIRSESGLAWVVLEEGAHGGKPPAPGDTILVEYTSYTTAGRMLDTTVYNNEPEVFSLDLTIAGFRETFTTMIPGERRQIWIPSEMTELDGRIVHQDTVVFDMKLLSYLSAPQTPARVASIPPDADRSVTGLAWKVIRPGTGERKPAHGDTVEVLYAGWTTDGEMFDAAYLHGRPGRFVLDDSMPLGWNEAIHAMVTGEKRLVWIPEDLAYSGHTGRPQGMLVFEIELLSINPD